MKRWLAVLLFMIMALLSFSTGVFAYRLEEKWTRSFSVGEGATLVLQNVNGSIAIDSWGRDEIEVVAEIRIKAVSKDKARKMFKRIEFEVDASDYRVAVKALLPKIQRDRLFGFFGESNTSITVAYSAHVPARTGVELSSINGHIEVDDVAGHFILKTTNGDIRVDSRGGEGKIETVNGTVECSLGEFPDGGSLDVEAVNGNIDVEIPEDAGARVDLKTASGRVEVGFDLDRVARHKRRHVQGTIGDGSGYINIRTTNGDINLESL